jgi:hypothetical protein
MDQNGPISDEPDAEFPARDYPVKRSASADIISMMGTLLQPLPNPI